MAHALAAAPLVNILTAEDYNGECFIAGSEGEREIAIWSNTVFVENYQAGVWNVGDLPVAVGAPHYAEMQTRLQNFVLINDIELIVDGHPAAEAHRIAYWRGLCARVGLLQPYDAPAAHHCLRSDFCTVNAADYDLGWGIAAFNLALLDPERLAIRLSFADAVCVVAYFFRVRGHHFQAVFENRYIDVWHKTLRADDNPGLPWSIISQDCLHAIFPDTLDDYCITCATEGRIAGTLIKRLNSAPAGVAGVAALRRGINDLTMVIPRILDNQQVAYDHLLQIEQQLATHRWMGSVNSRYYGAARIIADEGLLGSLASAVLAALSQFCPGSALGRSSALTRIASNAPISGAVIARIIGTAANSPEQAAALVGPSAFAPRVAPVLGGRPAGVLGGPANVA